MTVLVAAATRHGATKEIAEWVGAGLAARGADVEVRNVVEVDDLGGYDAFVVGSAVYLGQWLKPARSLLAAHAEVFARRPTWLFSSGPIVGDPPAADDPCALRAGLAETLVEATHAREHKVFAGKLDPSKLSWGEKIAVRGAQASASDFRDRETIDDWVASIVRELRIGEPLEVTGQ